MSKNYIGETISGYEILEKTVKKDTSGHFLYKCRCVHCGTIELKSIRRLNQQKGIRCSHFDKFGFPNFPYTYSIDRHLTKVFTYMKNRCYNKKSKDYKWYGGKGIKICNEWLYNPTSFSIWALSNGYKKGLSIDRINNDGDYEPNNCRWITISENSRKSKKCNFITIYGKTLSCRQWSKEIGKGVNYVSKKIKAIGIEQTINIICSILQENGGVV
jgi:hypothetical protein